MRRETGASPHRAASFPAVWIAAIGCAFLVAGAGCARHAKMQPPPSTDVTAGPKLERHEPPPADEEGIRLPGQDRYLPSEDPRNRPQGTPAAIPVPKEAASAEKRTAEAPPAASNSDSVSVADPARAVAPAVAAASAASPARVIRGPQYRVQVFASSIPQKARRIRDELASRTKEPVSVEEEGGIWKVRVGEPMGREEAGALRGRMGSLGYHDAFVTEVHPR